MVRRLIFNFVWLFLPILAQAGDDNNRFIRIGTGSVYSASFTAAQNLAVDASFAALYDKRGTVLKQGVIVAAQSFNDNKEALNALVANDIESAIVPAEYLFDRERGINRFMPNNDALKDIVVIGALKPMIGYFITRKYIKKLERKYLVSVNFGTNNQGSIGNAVFNDIMEQINLYEGDYNLITRRYEDLFIAFHDQKIDGFFVFDSEPIAGLKEFLDKNNAQILTIPDKIALELVKKYPSMERNYVVNIPVKFTTISMPLVWVSKKNYDFQLITDILPQLKRTDHNFMNKEFSDETLSLISGKRTIRLELHPAIQGVALGANTEWLKGIRRP